MRGFFNAMLGLWLATSACAPGSSASDDGGDNTPVFPSRNRPDVIGIEGAVSSDHPLASAAGYEVLQRGGTATDAVVTMAAVLSVVRPHMNGVGGDAFALFYEGSTGEIVGLNASGRAGRLASTKFFREQGLEEIPSKGALTVTVPGTVAGWADALERFGTIGLDEAVAPAIYYAEEGFPVSEKLRSDISESAEVLNEAGRKLFLPDGQAPDFGDRIHNRALANTFKEIARNGADAFYRGAIGRRIASFISENGGYLKAEDFASHTSTWVDPIGTDYLGHQVLAMPPNTQGFAQIQQMEMVKHFDLKAMGHNSAEYIHTLVEIKKLAFADRNQWLADPEVVTIPLKRLLDPEYLKARAGSVSSGRASSFDPGIQLDSRAEPGPQTDGTGDTVYITAVDGRGNAVSWIQSLFHSFGSGLVEPETGIVLQNRGALFRLDPDHPNAIEPGKRPFHTLTPLLVLRDGKLAVALGTPGGDGQTQSLLQIFNNLFLFGMAPQEAVEAPRFRSYDGPEVAIEDRVPDRVREDLSARGHKLRVISGWTATFGGAQMIFRHGQSDVLIAAAGPRREAYAIAY